VKATVCAALILSAAASEQKPARLEVELSPAERAKDVVRVLALDRDVPQKMTGKTVKIREVPATRVEGAADKWVLEKLKPGRYDLLVETRRGKFEGYALVPEEESEKKISDKDRAKIADIFKHVKTFEDQKRILDLGGNGRQAVALVELLRTRKTTYDRKMPGACIWRVEYWQFDKLYGAWTKGDSKVLRRFMAPKREFAGWNWNFVPELGGIKLAPGEKRTLSWKIPRKFDPARGRAAAPKRGPPEAAHTRRETRKAQ
jgi:hypothetical protein